MDTKLPDAFTRGRMISKPKNISSQMSAAEEL